LASGASGLNFVEPRILSSAGLEGQRDPSRAGLPHFGEKRAQATHLIASRNLHRNLASKRLAFERPSKVPLIAGTRSRVPRGVSGMRKTCPKPLIRALEALCDVPYETALVGDTPL